MHHEEVVDDKGADRRGRGDDRELERDAQLPFHDEGGEQHDHGLLHDTKKLFGWERISYRIPLYMFIFLVALGSDYNIFITTRIRGEALLHGLRDGTVNALAATGGVLTSAGIIHLGAERIRCAGQDPPATVVGPLGSGSFRGYNAASERREAVVSYTYQPKFPKAKLREVVTKYEAVMQTLGKAPNCSVAFVGADGSVSPAHMRGWLLKDPGPQAGGQRYLLLTDGDAWREVEPPAGADQDPDEQHIWLNGADDDLVTLLALSQANVRTGGTGFLEGEELVELDPRVVADRRQEQHPYGGPERRSR